jgi:hypothetical protein
MITVQTRYAREVGSREHNSRDSGAEKEAEREAEGMSSVSLSFSLSLYLSLARSLALSLSLRVDIIINISEIGSLLPPSPLSPRGYFQIAPD